MASAVLAVLVATAAAAVAYFALRRSSAAGINEVDPEGAFSTTHWRAEVWMMVGLVAAALVVLILLLVLNGDGPPSMRKVEAAKTYAIELAYGFEDNKPPAAFTFTTAR